METFKNEFGETLVKVEDKSLYIKSARKMPPFKVAYELPKNS